MRWHNPYRAEPNLNRSHTWCIRSVDTGEKVRDHLIHKAEALGEAAHMNAQARGEWDRKKISHVREK